MLGNERVFEELHVSYKHVACSLELPRYPFLEKKHDNLTHTNEQEGRSTMKLQYKNVKPFGICHHVRKGTLVSDHRSYTLLTLLSVL